MRISWRDFVKYAGIISKDGKTFVLGKGMSPWHVAKEWKAAHPEVNIGIPQAASMIVAANPGVRPSGYRAGVAYKMPNFHTVASAPMRPNPSSKAPQAADLNSMTMVSPHRGMRVPREFLDMMMHIDRYGVKNSEGKVDHKRLRAAIIDFFTNGNTGLKRYNIEKAPDPGLRKGQRVSWKNLQSTPMPSGR